MRKGVITLKLVILTLAFASESGTDADFDPATLSLKEVLAKRTQTPPKIDGDVSDAVWDEAELLLSFLQTQPEDLSRPTEKTEVRLLYDDENLYVAFVNFDSAPDDIVSRFARRDSWSHSRGGRGGGSVLGVNNSDWVGVALDSRNDNLTGYSFIVNAAGSKLDTYIYDDSRYDSSWDGVWDAKVQRSDGGWSAEFRLPFSLFNFSDLKDQIWGVSLRRFIFRKQEQLEWPGKKRGLQGNVSRFGVLKGLNTIPPPKQMELTPYALGGYHANGGEKFTRSAGVDMEYGVSSNTTAFMTVNPDFGQVEADPSVLNLSAFETFYAEKRPFFVEGMSIFNGPTGDFDGNLFHSRRIGARPGYYSPEDGSIIDRPDATNILSAAKVLGRTDSGLEFAVVDALTNREYASLQSDDGQMSDFLLEPYTNHFAGRMRKSVINDLSAVGIMLTDQRRESGHAATVGSADWRGNLIDNRLTFAGQLISSSTDGKTGNAGRFHLSYNDPVWWNASATYQVSDNSFDINDMGYLRRAGVGSWDIDFGIRQQNPWGPLLRSNLGVSYDHNNRSDGVLIRRQLNLSLSMTTLSYWNFGIHHGQILPSYSDEDLFRDSRAWIREAAVGYRGGAWLSTDGRKRLSFRFGLGYGWKDNGYGGYRYDFGTTVRASQRLSGSLTLTEHLRKTPQQWVGVVSNDAGDHRIYGMAKQLTNEITLRLSYALSPDLSFQTYLQPFRAKVDYSDYVELTAPMTRDYTAFNYSGDRSFIMDNTIGTFVTRWEYRPGSILYLVYNLNDRNYFSSAADSWFPTKSNTLFIKLNYWFQA